jgi:hypothetical protein
MRWYLSFFLSGLSPPIGRAGNVVALQAAVQGGACQARNSRLQGIQAVIKWQ